MRRALGTLISVSFTTYVRLEVSRIRSVCSTHSNNLDENELKLRRRVTEDDLTITTLI